MQISLFAILVPLLSGVLSKQITDINQASSISPTIIPNYNISCRVGKYKIYNLDYKTINNNVKKLTNETYNEKNISKYNSSYCGFSMKFLGSHENATSIKYQYKITYGLFNASECNAGKLKNKNYTMCIYPGPDILACDNTIVKCCADRNNYCNHFYAKLTASKYCEGKKGTCMTIINKPPVFAPTTIPSTTMPTTINSTSSSEHHGAESWEECKNIILICTSIIVVLTISNIASCVIITKIKRKKERKPLLEDYNTAATI